MPDDLRGWAEKTFGLSYLDELRLFIAWGVVRDKMIPVIRDFFYDETAFIRMLRAAIAALGMALHDGAIPLPWLNGPGAWWVGPVLVVFSFMLGAGDKTPPEVKQLAALVPEGK